MTSDSICIFRFNSGGRFPFRVIGSLDLKLSAYPAAAAMKAAAAASSSTPTERGRRRIH